MMTFDERTEKNIATLIPKAQVFAHDFMERAIQAMALKGVVVKIISGTRTYAEQNILYAKGRTAPGPRVTNARGGYSNHNFGIAFDIGLFKDGKYLTSSPLYNECGVIGESVGLEWGGRWKTFPDGPHYQLNTGLTIAQMRDRTAAGKSVA
jgi:peptidoglycan L-alanyl-D-glutamate endopeptidase CwlK